MYGETHDNRDKVLKEVIVSCVISCKKMGPKVFGVLPFGRIEEYLNVFCYASFHLFSTVILLIV